MRLPPAAPAPLSLSVVWALLPPPAGAPQPDGGVDVGHCAAPGGGDPAAGGAAAAGLRPRRSGRW
eukprot:gene33104-35020_t